MAAGTPAATMQSGVPAFTTETAARQPRGFATDAAPPPEVLHSGHTTRGRGEKVASYNGCALGVSTLAAGASVRTTAHTGQWSEPRAAVATPAASTTAPRT